MTHSHPNFSKNGGVLLTMPTVVKIILGLVAVLALVVVCVLIGYNYRKKLSEREIGSAEEEAKRIIKEPITSGEAKKRATVFEAKEEIH